MTEGKTKRIPIMFEKSVVDRLDEFAFENRIRTRAAAVRMLVLQGIQDAENKEADARA